MKIDTKINIIVAVIIITIFTVSTFFALHQVTGIKSLYEFGTENDCAVIVLKNYDDYGFINMTGSSMAPAITESNTVVVEKIERYGVQNVVRGDVIVFPRGEDLICHRVVAVNSNSFTTKGDANPVGDPEAVSFDDVKYIVIAIFR